jgi:cell division protein ZapA (FtsZ GTPase activity inhibitor)
MKQKYTLLIADMEINVVTDQPEDSVEYIVGILDRKIREIILKSKRCSKNEAALLCALDFCAEKIQIKERTEELENLLADTRDDMAQMEEKIEMLKKNLLSVEKENARLEAENDRLRAIMETKTGVSAASAAVSPAPVVVPVTVEEQPKEVAPTEKVEETKKSKVKNRVGSMFDLLTFSDI